MMVSRRRVPPAVVFLRCRLGSESPRWQRRDAARFTHRSIQQQSANTSATKEALSQQQQAFGIGAVAGVLGSLAGMGGGFVMIPLLTSSRTMGGLALSQHQAHGTSLFAVAATGLAGAVSYGAHVQWPEATAIALTGMVTARLGAQSAAWLSPTALKRALGGLMLVMAPAVHFKAQIVNRQEEGESQQQQQLPIEQESEGVWFQRITRASLIGTVSGYMAGLFGVGGGVIVVPALTLFAGDACQNHYQALATSLAAMVLPAAAGTWTHYQAGNVAIRAAPPLAVGALAGAYVGGQVAQNWTHESTLRWGFSGLLLFLGIKTLTK